VELLGGLIALAIVFLILVLPIVSFVFGVSSRRRIAVLEARADRAEAEAKRLRDELRRVEKAPAVVESPPPAATTAPPPSREAAPIPPAAQSVRPAPALDTPPPPLPAPGPAEPTSAPPARATPPPQEPWRPSPPTPERPPRPAPPPRPPAPPRKPIDWEGIFGEKLAPWLAAIAIVISAGLFLAYSIQQGWLAPPIRVAIGLAVGMGLIVACELKASRRYSKLASAGDAAGVAILLITAWASHVLWHLLGAIPTFGFMALVTAVAVALSVRRDSLFIALLGLVGGFATPALLSTGVDHPIGLFGYLLMLSVGLGFVAWRKRWPLLSGLALALTTFYQWGWVHKFLDDGKLPIATVIFLAFPVMNAVMFALVRRQSTSGEAAEPFGNVASVSACLPLLFAMYALGTPEYGSHAVLTLGFLLVVNAGLAATAILRGPSALLLVGAASSVLGWIIWLVRSYERTSSWPTVLWLVAAFVLFHLVVPEIARRMRRPVTSPGSMATLAAPALFVAFPWLAVSEPTTASPWLLFGVAMGLLVAVWLGAMRELGSAWGFGLGALLCVIAEATWIPRHLPHEPGFGEILALLGMVGVALAALPWISRRIGIRLAPGALEGLSASSVLLLVPIVAWSPAAMPPPWGWLALLGLLAVVACVDAVHEERPYLFAAIFVTAPLALIAWREQGNAWPWPRVAMMAAIGLGLLALATWLIHARLAHARGRAPLTTIADVAGIAIILAQVVAATFASTEGAPALGEMGALVLPLVVAALVVAGTSGRHAFAIAAIPAPAIALFLWAGAHFDEADGIPMIVVAFAVHAAFLAYPLLLGPRAGRRIEPHLAAVLSSLPCFFLARGGMFAAGWDGAMGLLAVVQAALLTGVLAQLLRWEKKPERQDGRLAMIAAAALLFITAAIPLQFDRQWITLGWALEVAALGWLYRRIPHRGLLWFAVGLAVAVFVRLSANPAVLEYHPRADVPIFNWWLYTYLLAAGGFFAAAKLLRATNDTLARPLPRFSSMLAAAATWLLFLLLNIEIADFWSEGTTLTFKFSAGRAVDLSYTIGWAVFAIGLLVAGVIAKNKPARIASSALLMVTVLKAFLHDLISLQGLYRVGSFMLLAICLAVVALIFQRFVLRPAREEDSGT